MNNIQQRVQEVKTNGYDLDFGDIFNQSLENFKKISLSSGLALFIFTMIMLMFFGGGAAALYGADSLVTEMASLSNIGAFSIVGLLTYFVTLVLVACVVAPFYSGLLKMAFLADNNEEFSLSTAFDYYKSSFLKELISAQVIISLFTVGITILFEKIGFSFVGGFLTYAISFATIFVNLFIIFGNLKAVEAINASLIIVTKKMPVLLGLFIVGLIIACLGAIGLCIGVFFTMPFIFSLEYIIFKNIFDIQNVSEIDEIGTFKE